MTEDEVMEIRSWLETGTCSRCGETRERDSPLRRLRRIYARAEMALEEVAVVPEDDGSGPADYEIGRADGALREILGELEESGDLKLPNESEADEDDRWCRICGADVVLFTIIEGGRS